MLSELPPRALTDVAAAADALQQNVSCPRDGGPVAIGDRDRQTVRILSKQLHAVEKGDVKSGDQEEKD
jgi:hypothetical protein